MPTRLSPVAVCVIVAVAVFTSWITWRAKALERDLDVNSTKLTIIGKQAPDFHLPALDGHTVSLSDFHGKRLAVIFWASWNNGSHPAMTSIALFYRNNHPDDANFGFVAIAVGDEQKAAKDFADQNKITFPVLLDNSEATAKAYSVRSIPSAVVIDEKGKITWGTVGFTQRMPFDMARELGIPNIRMDFGGPNGGRRN
jgi:peroxiredoxin